MEGAICLNRLEKLPAAESSACSTIGLNVWSDPGDRRDLVFDGVCFGRCRIETLTCFISQPATRFLPPTPPGGDSGEVWRSSRPQHRGRQRSRQPPVRHQRTGGVHLQGEAPRNPPVFNCFSSLKSFLSLSSLCCHQVIPHGLACQSGLRVGDRILEVNAIDLRHATHQEAVRALLANKQEIRMLVRRDPSPPGMQVRP